MIEQSDLFPKFLEPKSFLRLMVDSKDDKYICHIKLFLFYAEELLP